MASLEEAVRRALESAPGSLRALAREAGVPHSTLVRIKGKTRDATPEVAKALAGALRRWAVRCDTAEGRLQESLAQEVDE